MKLQTISKDSLANREIERANSKAANGLVKVKFSSIVVRDGFNLRQDFDGLEELADSIASEGLRDPLKVDMLKDGKCALTDGERRYRAIEIIRKRNKELAAQFSDVPVLLNAKDLTETDRLVAMLATQGQKPFNALEEMEGYNRLMAGWMGEPPLTVSQIAVRVGRSIPYLEQKLLLNKASDEEKKMIRENKLSATAAQALIRQEGDSEKRVTRIKSKTEKGVKFKVKDALQAPAIELCDDIIQIVAVCLKGYDFTDMGGLKNELLNIDSKARGIKKTIE